VVADRADALDVGEAGQILPVLRDLEELYRGACARHRLAVILDRGLVRRARCRRGAGIDIVKQDRIAQVRMVLLYARRLMHTAFADRACDLHLGAIASIVSTQPWIASFASKSAVALVSFDFSAVAVLPSTIPMPTVSLVKS